MCAGSCGFSFWIGTDLGGIVKADVGQGEVAAALQANWGASIEAADAGDVPSLVIRRGPKKRSNGRSQL